MIVATVPKRRAALANEDVVQSLAALAQVSRLAVYRALVQTGTPGLSAGRLARLTGLTPSALTFHLKTLTGAGLVESSKDGRYVIYRANYTAMNSLLSFLTENCCQGVGEFANP